MKTKMWQIGLAVSVMLLSGLVAPAFGQIYANPVGGDIGVENDGTTLTINSGGSVMVYFPAGCLAVDSPTAPWVDVTMTFTGMAYITVYGYNQYGDEVTAVFNFSYSNGASFDFLTTPGLSGGVYGFLIVASGTVVLDAVRADNYICTNAPPVAVAGGDVTIASADQALTILQGTASDVDGDAMQYRWLEGTTELMTWADVVDGAVPLDLGGLPTFALGDHTLTLEVTDGTATSSASMTLTLLNTPPAVSVNPTSQTVELGIDAILITGTVADFDADSLTYEWSKDGEVLESGTLNPSTEGPYELLDLVILAGDPRFPLGTNTVTLQVSDGTNVKTAEATVEVVDSMVPTLAPTPSVSMLWPPDHQLVPVTVYANAADNGGGGIALTVSVQCNEDDGGTDPDWYVDSIDNTTGTVQLRLRAERFGKGDGRIYTITVVATDESLNESSASVEVCVPHDKRKK